MPKEKTNAEQRLENEGGPPLNVVIKSDKLAHMVDEIDPIKDSRIRLDIRGMAEERREEIGERTYNGTTYVCDKMGAIAIKGIDGPPNQIKNEIDWGEVQLNLVQFDLVYTSGNYFHRREKMGKEVQDVLNQFEVDSDFENLGNWRVRMGLKRNLDITVLSNKLDFNFPDFLTVPPRKLFICTTSVDLKKGTEKFENAHRFEKKGAEIIIAETLDENGRLRVDGMKMSQEMFTRGYRLAKNMAGPSVLDTLRRDNVLDLMIITLVHLSLDADPKNLITIPINMANKDEGFDGFTLLKGFAPEVAIARDGTPITQEFLVYENKNAAHG